MRYSGILLLGKFRFDEFRYIGNRYRQTTIRSNSLVVFNSDNYFIDIVKFAHLVWIFKIWGCYKAQLPQRLSYGEQLLIGTADNRVFYRNTFRIGGLKIHNKGCVFVNGKHRLVSIKIGGLIHELNFFC